MKIKLLIAGAFLLLGLHVAHAENEQPVQTVASVDLLRYVGKWYEIAAFPMFFQRQCVGDTTAEYARLPDGAIGVTNRCRTASGVDEAKARATVVEGSGNARLKVTFFWPFSGDYWIIGLDPEYRWVVVGSPKRNYLWILSRTPEMLPADRAAANAAATAQGFDLSKLRESVQSMVDAPPFAQPAKPETR